MRAGVRRAYAVRIAAFVVTAFAVAGAGLALQRDADVLAVPDPQAPASAAGSCRRFAAALPDRLGELKRRRTTPDRPGLAAYGDPAVLVRCGAALTGNYRVGDSLLAVNDVPWFAEERPDAVVFSLPRALVNVEVTIPRRYPAELLSLLSDAVRQAQPL